MTRILPLSTTSAATRGVRRNLRELLLFPLFLPPLTRLPLGHPLHDHLPGHAPADRSVLESRELQGTLLFSTSSSRRCSFVATFSSSTLNSSASSSSSLSSSARVARKASAEESTPSPAKPASAGDASEGTPAPGLNGATGRPCGPATCGRGAGRVPGRGALSPRGASYVPCSSPSCLTLAFFCRRSASCCSTGPALWWSFSARASCTAVRTCRCHARGRRSLRR